jgi:hypothetical protein
MNVIKTLKKILSLVIAMTSVIVGFILLKREKGGEIDREKIKKDAEKKIMDTPSPDFIKQYPGVGAAGERGTERFTSRVKRILHQGGSRGADPGGDDDSRR